MPKWTSEQLEAIQKSGSNIIVSAGAGSGKTAVLSERVIYKLTHGIHIQELLILTFTRAAADEMKDRIRKKIESDPSLENELDALDSSYITTFDSFALSVVKKYHYLVNIKKDIEITDDSIIRIERQKILDEVFNKRYKKREEKFVKFIKTYSLKNDRELKKKILELIDKLDNYLNRNEFFNFIKENYFKKENLNSILDAYHNYIENKKDIVSMELSNMHSYFDEKYLEKINSIVLPIINSKTLDELWSHDEYKLPAVPRGTDDEAKRVKETLKNALNDLMALKEFGNDEKIINDILSTKDTIEVIVDILEDYYVAITKFKKENDIYTFMDIAELSIKIIDEFKEVRDELTNKLKEIMIDEYQDTNDIQEKFISLISNNNVYMVGDIKQSIYRFRGSNPNIFKDKYDKYSKCINGYKIDLIKNFRSRKEVLDDINKIFELIMDNSLGGANYKESHEMIFGNEDYLNKKQVNFKYDLDVLEYINEDETYKDEEIEIFTIANDIKNKIKSKCQVYDKKTGELREIKYSDMVIILDRSKNFDLYKKIFEYLEIPLTILKDDKLNTSIDMYLIKNLINLVIKINEDDINDDFKYSFMSIARSFLYEYEDSYIFDVITQNEYKDTTIYNDLKQIDNINSLSTKEILLKILDITKIYNKLSKIGDYENINIRINKLLDLSVSLGQMGYDIYDYKKYLESIIEEDMEIKYTGFTEDVDSVKIMTIHKSKGLEYPICYFADLAHGFNTMELKSKFIVDKTYGIVAPVFIDNVDTPSVLKELYTSEYIEEEVSEKIRLFYVALTRAREKIIIVVPDSEWNKLEKDSSGVIDKNRRLKFKSLADFIYGIKMYLPNYFTKIDLNKIPLTKKYLYNKKAEDLKYDNDVDFEVEEIDIPYIEKKEKIFSTQSTDLLNTNIIENMKFGTKVHEVLEYIDFKNFDKDTIEDKFIREKIMNFLNSDLLKNIKDAKVYHEYEFIYEKDDTVYHGSIDLMLEYNDHIDIIDYKLKNTKSEHYIDQLFGYKKYIEKISNKKVNTYLYSIIDETIEEIK